MSGILFEAAYRSGLERKVAKQLADAGVGLTFESVRLPYTVPEKEHHYVPDWVDEDRKIIVEAKGRFGHFRGDSQGARERQKMILVKEQHSDWEIWIIFQDAAKKIYKGSPTTYAKWATDHGFNFSDKGLVPAELIAKLKAKPAGRSLAPKRSKKRNV